MDGLDVILICFSLLGTGLLACSWMQQRHWAGESADIPDPAHPATSSPHLSLFHQLIEHLAQFDTLDDTEDRPQAPR